MAAVKPNTGKAEQCRTIVSKGMVVNKRYYPGYVTITFDMAGAGRHKGFPVKVRLTRDEALKLCADLASNAREAIADDE